MPPRLIAPHKRVHDLLIWHFDLDLHECTLYAMSPLMTRKRVSESIFSMRIVGRGYASASHRSASRRASSLVLPTPHTTSRIPSLPTAAYVAKSDIVVIVITLRRGHQGTEWRGSPCGSLMHSAEGAPEG